MKTILFVSFLLSQVASHAQNSSWQITGNSNTNPQMHFIGTADNVDVVFKRNNVRAGLLSSTNTAFGHLAFANNTSGAGCVAVGNYALLNNTTGYNNSAFGYNALNSNSIGGDNTAVGSYSLPSNIDGTMNTAVGSGSLRQNISGSYNTSVGNQTLGSNSSGVHNAAIGFYALHSNSTGGRNTASGSVSLYYNTTGSYNTASGDHSLFSNVTGNNNTASGVMALSSNGSGSFNTATGSFALIKNIADLNSSFGSYSMYNNLYGQYNTAIGGYALSVNVNGNWNTALGYMADVRETDLQNATAVGAFAVATQSDQVMIGNTAVTSIGGVVEWSRYSDMRFKKNVQENVPGLDFIKQLKPVTYNLDVSGLNKYLSKTKGTNENPGLGQELKASIEKKEKQVQSGFLAQEVEEAAKKLNYSFSGVVAPEAGNEQSIYALRYAEFVVPLVKAVQELSAENENLKSELQQMKQQLFELSQEIRKGKSVAVANLKVFPNPGAGAFTITSDVNLDNSGIQVFDMNGKSQPFKISNSGSNQKKVTLVNAAKGIYLLHLTTLESKSSVQLVVR